ncbi:TPA: hypothetical protein DCX15_03985 [bacterium]|nr:hypothetical protein [bacterium]
MRLNDQSSNLSFGGFVRISLIWTFPLVLFLPAFVWAHTVAILEFKDKSSPPSIVAPSTIHKLFTDLFPPEEFTLIDRDLTQKIVPPSTREALGEITPSMARVLGQILGADILVIGDYQEVAGGGTLRGSLYITASFIDTSRSQLSPRITRQITDLFEMSFARQGLVEAVTDRIILLNIGSFHGVQIGDRFLVERSGYLVGEIQVSRVERYMSEALLISSDGAVQVGDVVYRRPIGPVSSAPRRILIVDSTPSGARFNLNGIQRGIAPLIIYEPDIRIHTIDLLKDGYLDFIEEIIIEESPSSFLDANLVLAKLQQRGYPPSAKESSLIISSSPSNAKVYLDGELKGITPIAICHLPSGLFRVKVAKTGYKSVEHEIVLKEQEERRLNINLEPSPILEAKVPPAKPIPPPPELFQVQTPYGQSRGGFYLALKCPEIFAFRIGAFLEGLELRLQGPGLGAKYQFRGFGFERVAVDLYWRFYDMRHKEKDQGFDLRAILGAPFDSGFGLMNLTAGVGYRNAPEKGFHLFGGFDSYLTPKLKLLAEYDNLDGFVAGLRYDLFQDIRFALGAGNEPDGTPRLDASLSLQR